MHPTPTADSAFPTLHPTAHVLCSSERSEVGRRVGGRNRAGWIVAFASTIALACSSLSCNESLPVYQSPSSAFRGTISANYFRGKGAIVIRAVVWNTFDETLQDFATLAGTLEIIMKRDQQYHRTVDLSADLLSYSPNRFDQTGRMTIDPGDSLVFVYEWPFIDDNGVSLPTTVFRIMSTGEPHALEETFIIKGTLSVFFKTPDVVFEPIECPVTYYY